MRTRLLQATWIFASLLFIGTPSRSLTAAVLSKAPKQVAIQILAAGVTNEEIIELEIDGTVVAVYENVGGNAYAGQFVTLSFSDPQIDSINVLRINFINDLLSGTIDRNVRIDAVIIDGQRYETEDPSVYSVGSWRELDGCGPGFKESEFLNCNGFFEFRPGIDLNPIAGTFGESTITHRASLVQLQNPVTSPVIITSVPTFNDAKPGLIEIDNVRNTGFSIRFREWEYLNPVKNAETQRRRPLVDEVNPVHAAEAVEWLALEPDVYFTADGSVWEVGTLSASNNYDFVSKTFDHNFDAAPIVFTTVQTANGPPVTARIRNVTASWGDTATNDENDPDQFLAQDINAPAGKVLRINPGTGLGYPANPYYTGNAADVASKVWAFGLRNGFRIERVPGTGGVGDPGMFIVADVGRNDFEEIDVISGGENLGWPYYEANQRFRLGGDNLTITFPAIAFPHPTARSVIGGAFYQGTQWPAQYDGQFFVSDFVTGWLRCYVVNPDGSLTELDFGVEVKGMTDMKFDPSNETMYLVGRGRDIIFGPGEGLDGLYSIKFVGE